MIVLVQTLLPASFAAALQRLVATLGAALGGVVICWRNRREIQDLATFDDRMLSDVGLTRVQVTQALDEPFLREWARLVVRCCEPHPLLSPSSRPMDAGRIQRVA